MVNSGSSANLVMIGAVKKFSNGKIKMKLLFLSRISNHYASICQHGLKPVFIDIEFETLNFNVNLIEEKITPKTKAFISPVLGNPPDFDKLLKISEKHNLKLILDNCDSLGGKWRDVFLVNTVKCLRHLFILHHMCTGEGGMVSSNNRNYKGAEA